MQMQFRQQNNNKPTRQGNSEATFQKAAHVSDMTASQVAESSHFAVEAHAEPTKCDSHQGRVSVLSRIRVPVTYGDLFGENAEDGLT